MRLVKCNSKNCETLNFIMVIKSFNTKGLHDP